MFKPLNRPGHWGALMQMVFDVLFFAVLVLSALKWLERGLPGSLTVVAGYAAILAAAVLVLKLWPPARRRIQGGDSSTRMRLGLLLYLMVPAAYGMSAILPVADVKRGFLEISAMVAAFTILTSRVMAFSGMPAAMRQRAMVFGIGKNALVVEAAFRSSSLPVDIVGFYPAPTEKEPRIPVNWILPTDKSLIETARERRADSIVVAVEERRGGAIPLHELLDCKLTGIRVMDLESYFERTLGQIRLEALYAGWLVFGEGFRQGWVRTAAKRLFDVFFAALLFTLALPVMALAALAIVLESGFPIFYTQERVGLHGRLFKVVKFRSMRTDAERDGEPRWATAKDDRVTRVGRILRKLRIDELPQLISVLAGDMSLVGPRPERPFFVDKLMREIPFYAVRHSIKPGLTGWAQVRYHYGASVQDSVEKLQYDLYYVKNHSFFLDLLILYETVGVVLTAKGAN